MEDRKHRCGWPAQRAIGPSHGQPMWRTPVKHVQLMPQNQDLGFQPPP
jgi:hypothetical protein